MSDFTYLQSKQATLYFPSLFFFQIVVKISFSILIYVLWLARLCHFFRSFYAYLRLFCVRLTDVTELVNSHFVLYYVGVCYKS